MCGVHALEVMCDVLSIRSHVWCPEHSKSRVVAHALEALCGDLCIKSLRAAEAETGRSPGVTDQPRLLGKLQAKDRPCLIK